MADQTKLPVDETDEEMRTVYFLASFIVLRENIAARLNELRERKNSFLHDDILKAWAAEEERLQLMDREYRDVIRKVTGQITRQVTTRWIDFRDIRIEKLGWVTEYLARVIPLMVTEDPTEAADKLNDILKPQPISKNQWAEEPEFRRAPAYVCTECGNEYLWLTPDFVPPFVPKKPRLLCPKHFKEECGKSLKEDAVVQVLNAFLPGFKPPVISHGVRAALGLTSNGGGQAPTTRGPKWVARIRIGEHMGISASLVEKNEKDSKHAHGFRRHPEQLVSLFLNSCFPGLDKKFVDRISKRIANKVPEHQHRLSFLT